jgi:ABC-type bacteriocin/lantibiotic exporter with double-glycine peptidase domain
MICLVSYHTRDSFMARHMGGIYLGNHGVRFQTGINNCGPTSLQMIFDYYRIPSTVQEIEQTIGMNEKGSTMLALKEMSELKGLHAEGWRLTPHDFSNIMFPALLYIHDDHFVVADSIWNDNVFVRDPAIGRLEIPKGKLTQIWKGEILLFKRN